MIRALVLSIPVTLLLAPMQLVAQGALKEDVPLGIAEDTSQSLAEQHFPGIVAFDSPERQVDCPVPPCGGLSAHAPQTLIRATYSASGNSGYCINDGTGAIAIQM